MVNGAAWTRVISYESRCNESIEWNQKHQVFVILWHQIQAHEIIEKSKDSNDVFIELLKDVAKQKKKIGIKQETIQTNITHCSTWWYVFSIYFFAIKWNTKADCTYYTELVIPPIQPICKAPSHESTIQSTNSIGIGIGIGSMAVQRSLIDNFNISINMMSNGRDNRTHTIGSDQDHSTSGTGTTGTTGTRGTGSGTHSGAHNTNSNSPNAINNYKRARQSKQTAMNTRKQGHTSKL